MKLTQLPPQLTAEIKAINLPPEDAAILWELGVGVKSKITLVRFFLRSTALVVVDGAVVAIGKEYADAIEAEPC